MSDYKTLGLGSVVVTSREGIYRFSYEGHPSGSGLMPWAICADALSHILVCDENTHTVHLIDRDGRFLSYLLIRPQGVFTPRSLGYDVTTQRLWVGSDIRQTVCVYRYITRKITQIGMSFCHFKLCESIKHISCLFSNAIDFYDYMTMSCRLLLFRRRYAYNNHNDSLKS